MISKSERIKNLRQVKLVLGNGFDLYCGLHTRYKDFFGKDALSKKASEWLIANVGHAQKEIEEKQFYAWESEIDIASLVGVCAWDLFFVMYFGLDEDHYWCDIEEGMLLGLTNDDKSTESWAVGYPHWKNVYEFLHMPNVSSKSRNIKSWLLAAFINKRNPELRKKGEQCFYDFLLQELKSFEERFGEYVLLQHVRSNQFVCFVNHPYLKYTSRLLNDLASIDEITAIDCFNYCFPPLQLSDSFDDCHFVNGSFANPIFGVDTIFAPDDPRFVFTKTNRRVELDMDFDYSYADQEFLNAVVFGHSLCQPDYNYFFPLLDQLEMMNTISTKKFVFAYCVPQGADATRTKKEKRQALYALFTKYALSRGIQESEAGRFLDSLTTRGRIVTLEIYPIRQQDDSFAEKHLAVPNRFKSRKDAMNDLWDMYVEYCGKLKKTDLA